LLEGATSETIVAGSNSGRRTGFIAADSSRDDRRFQTDVMLPAASRAAFRVFVLVHISAALGGVFTGSRKRSGQRMTTLGWIVLQKAQHADLGEADTRLRNAIDGFAGRTESDGSGRLVGLARM